MSTSKSSHNLADDLLAAALTIRQNAAAVDRLVRSLHPEVANVRCVIALQKIIAEQVQMSESFSNLLVRVAEELDRGSHS